MRELSRYKKMHVKINEGIQGQHCAFHAKDIFVSQGVSSTFILNNLERRKDKLKTQLVWIGAQKEPQITARTWRWVDGELAGRTYPRRSFVRTGPRGRSWITRGEIRLSIRRPAIIRRLRNDYAI